MFKHWTLIVSGLLFAGGGVAQVVEQTPPAIVGGLVVQAAAAFIAYRRISAVDYKKPPKR